MRKAVLYIVKPMNISLLRCATYHLGFCLISSCGVPLRRRSSTQQLFAKWLVPPEKWACATMLVMTPHIFRGYVHFYLTYV